ncbi:hypothetical protein [Vibrio phage Va2]|nr:hypothetical protein [Vibrio phage Va2]
MSERSTTMSGIADQIDSLIMQLSSSLGVPIIFDPSSSYEEVVKSYRTQRKEDYGHQGHTGGNTVPTLIGWRRTSLRRNSKFARRATIPHFIKEIDRAGKATGNTVKFVELLGELDIDFTIYSKDMEWVEDFEITYLSSYGIRKYKHIEMHLADTNETGNSFADFSNQVWKSSVSWNDDLGQILFERIDNFVITLDFSCKVQGSFFSRIDGAKTHPVIYKVVHDTELES